MISNNNETSFRANERSGFFILEDINNDGKGISNVVGSLMKNTFAKRQ